MKRTHQECAPATIDKRVYFSQKLITRAQASNNTADCQIIEVSNNRDKNFVVKECGVSNNRVSNNRGSTVINKLSSTLAFQTMESV